MYFIAVQHADNANHAMKFECLTQFGSITAQKLFVSSISTSQYNHKYYKVNKYKHTWKQITTQYLIFTYNY